MKTFMRNLIYANPDQREFINPLIHVFFFITFCFGFFFVFLAGLETTTATILYQVSVRYFDGTGISLWGILALSVTVLNTVAMGIRGRVGLLLLPGVVLGGIYCWLYASIIYFLSGYVLQALVAGVANLAFWFYYGVQVRMFRQREM